MLSILAVAMSFVSPTFAADTVNPADEGLDAAARRELRAMLAVENLRDEVGEESAAAELPPADTAKVNRSPAVLGPPTAEPVDYSVDASSGN